MRLCKFGCGEIGSLDHFLQTCSALTAKRVLSLDRHDAAIAAENPLRFWRETARRVECRWSERAQRLRAVAAEPLHPVAAHDDAIAQEIDNVALGQLTPSDIRFYAADKIR